MTTNEDRENQGQNVQESQSPPEPLRSVALRPTEIEQRSSDADLTYKRNGPLPGEATR